MGTIIFLIFLWELTITSYCYLDVGLHPIFLWCWGLPGKYSTAEPHPQPYWHLEVQLCVCAYLVSYNFI